MSDASFLDGREQPVKLLGKDNDDLGVISALCQDAIAERKEMQFDKHRREFSLLLKRFRWEVVKQAKAQNRAFERVQSILQFRCVEGVQFSGFDANDQSLAFDMIAVTAQETEAGVELHIVFAGDGEIRIQAEEIDVVLADVSRPYRAKSPHIPEHNISIEKS